MNSAPPARAERLMRWSLAPWERPAILGDLSEEFEDILVRKGSHAAGRWYWGQALWSIWPNLIRRVKGDEDRSRGVQAAFWQLGFAGFYLVADLARDRFPWRAILWSTGGIFILLDSVFRKRQIIRRRAPTGLLLFFVAGLGVLVLTISYAIRQGAVSEAQAYVFVMAVSFGAFVWPRRVRSDEEVFDVRHKLTPDLEREALLTVTVPNERFGLSRVILRRAPDRNDSDPVPLHTYDPIIDRTFTSDREIRAFAIVNLPDSGEPVAARIELIDDAGGVVKRITTPVVAGHLQQVGPWALFADQDPANHFGQIDATVPLLGLTPGGYTLRVSVGNVARSVNDEPISIIGYGSAAPAAMPSRG